MTLNQVRGDIGFKRCAVCKIDLKGRFVYVDDKVEKLLGLTKEDLFGKSLLEYLDERSQNLVSQLLCQRNHYETFYDTGTITLLNASGDPVVARTVISLNFIAGNPVNFQIVLDQWDSPDRAVTQISRAEHYEQFTEKLLGLESFSDWKEILRLLCRFVGARQACIYHIKDDNLEPRSASSDDTSAEFVYKTIPDPTELHRNVARSGEPYSFIDQEAVRRMIESTGAAPNEYVLKLELDDHEPYLLRFIFADDFDHQKAMVAMADTRIALNMIHRLAALQQADGNADGSFDIKFTIGFLDSLGIGALLIDSGGLVIGYNPVLLKLFDEKLFERTYTDLVTYLVSLNEPGIEQRIVDYLTGREQNSEEQQDLSLPVKISPDTSARLTVLKLAEGADDLTACFVFVLPETGSQPKAAPVSSMPVDVTLWPAVFSHLHKRLKTVGRVGDRLAHEFYNELGTRGNELVTAFGNSVSEMFDVVGSLTYMLHLTQGSLKTDLIDLNVVVKRTLEKLIKQYPRAVLNCRYENLPKVAGNARILSAVLHQILTNAVSYNDKPKIDISITATTADSMCRLTISDNGMGLSREAVERVFDPFFRVADPRVAAVPGCGMGLTISRKMLQTLGGDVILTSVEGEGTSVLISLPA